MRRILFALSLATLTFADVIECENGDRYNGKVLLVDEHSVKLQNEITGVLTIPRSKVASITFRTQASKAAATNAVVSATATAPAADPAARAIEQVQEQFLSGAGPEANQMFQDMVRDLLSGKLGVEDVRAQAQTTLKELNDLQADLGDDDAAMLLGSYAAILQNFLNSATSAPARTPAKPGQ
jgi:hypothetical protein